MQKKLHGHFKITYSSLLSHSKHFFSALFLFVFFSLPAEEQPRALQRGFIENKGQITDQNQQFNSAVKYLLRTPEFNVQLRSTGFSYDTYTEDPISGEESPLPTGKNFQPGKRIRHYHRVDIELKGSNAQAQLLAEQPSKEYYNYLTASGSPRGASAVHSYQKVTYKDIYPHIDLEFFIPSGNCKTEKSQSAGVEYNFVVHPGGRVKDIQLEYSGANNIRLANNTLSVQVTAGTFTENIPLAYLEEGKQKVEVRYKTIAEHVYAFDISSRENRTSDLIIDPAPSLSWSTYYGGNATDEALGITIDASGNSYVTGYSNSTANIATSGSYQNTMAGLYDSYIAKFNSTGTGLLWATYYGGAGYDYAQNIALDASGNIYIVGYTSSTSGIATAGAYQAVYAGGAYDVFVAKFNSTGTSLLWGTYYGGVGGEVGSGIAIDASGNPVITGYTQYSTNLATAGAYRTNYNGVGGAYNIFIAKFNTSGTSLLWGTYYGGGQSGGDYSASIALDASGNSYVTGYTNSSSGIATAGAYQTIYRGGYEGFVAKFNSTGTALVWGTYYGAGTYAECFSLALDAGNNVYITGETSSTNYIATTGAYQQSFGGGTADAFVAKINSSGTSLLWGTYYGGSVVDEGKSIAVDASGNTYITGFTTSTNHIASAGAYQSAYAGGTGDDAFIAEFNSTGTSLLWGTYYGGKGSDAAESMAIDGNGNTYITGYTASTNGFVTAGAYQTAYGGGGSDVFVAKFGTPTAARYWVGNSNSNWNNTSNWSYTSGGSGGASVPGSSNTVFFDANGTGNCSMDVNVSVLEISIAGYTKILTQNSTTITVDSLWSMSSGTFTGGSAAINLAGNFLLTGGSFTSTSNTFSITGNYTISGGTFLNNSGTVLFNGTASQTVNVNNANSDSFYKLHVNKPGGSILYVNSAIVVSN